MPHYSVDDPIYALATPFAPSALAVIRGSGDNIIQLFEPLFTGKLGKVPTNTAVHGFICDQEGRKIDEAISYIDTVSSGYAELQNRYKVLQEDNQNLNETSSKMLSMLSTRMESIQQLLELASLYESRPAVFYSKFKDLIKVSQFNNTELEQEIISTTNLSYHNILDDLKAMHPDLSLHELCYCGLICLGFSQQSIRVLYDHTNINSIYSLRARIRAKLGISNSNKNLDTYFKELIREKYQ